MAGKGTVFVFTAAGLGLFALALTAVDDRKNMVTPKQKGMKKMTKGNDLVSAASRFSPEVLASAKKWAAKRGVPLNEILATILLESRGNPKAHLLNDKEDSRGLMQVNIRAHGATLKKLGYTPDDLYKVDVGIEVGSLLYAQARAKVADLVKKCKAPSQAHDLGTLTRLYYAGPKYVIAMLQKAKTTADTAHAFKNSETYVDHWHDATSAVATAYA